MLPWAPVFVEVWVYSHQKYSTQRWLVVMLGAGAKARHIPNARFFLRDTDNYEYQPAATTFEDRAAALSLHHTAMYSLDSARKMAAIYAWRVEPVRLFHVA